MTGDFEKQMTILQADRKVWGQQEAARGEGQRAAQVRPPHRQRELASHLHHGGRQDAKEARRKDLVCPDQGRTGKYLPGVIGVSVHATSQSFSLALFGALLSTQSEVPNCFEYRLIP